jgi:hypothetical protein
MKPIQTSYKGCKFRSRLEARWAVFFDSLGIIWEYEKEGFVLSTGDTYLPDFWLPQLDCFFEARAYDFYIWNWTMEIDLPPFICDEFPDAMVGSEDTEDRRKTLVELDRQYYFQKYQDEHPKYKWGRYEKSLSWSKRESGYQFALEPDRENPEVSAAYVAARSARFESF